MKEHALVFINNKIERYSSQNQKTGITNWALLAGAVWCLSQILTSTSEITSPEEWLSIFLLSTLGTTTISCLSSAIKPKTNAVGKLDTKIHNSNDLARLESVVMLMVPYILTLAALTYLGITSELANNNIIKLIAITPTILLTLIFLFTSIILITAKIKPEYFTESYHTKKISKQYQFTNNTSHSLKIKLTYTTISLVYLLFFLERTSTLEFEELKLVLPTVFYLVTLLEISNQCISKALARDDSLLTSLENLENEILLKNLDEDSIRTKLKDIFGYNIIDWLSNEEDKQSQKTKEFIEALNSIDEKIKEILQIDSSFKHEREARQQELLQKIDKHFSSWHESHHSLKYYLENGLSKKSFLPTEEEKIMSIKRDIIQQYEETIDLYQTKYKAALLLET